MRSFNSAIASVLFLLLTFQAQSQIFSKKYVRKNKDAPIASYADSGIYARGLYVDSTFIFFGNSNGAVYRYDTKKEQSVLVMKFPMITEIRDLEAANDLIYAMHSGDDGLLVKIGNQGPLGFIRPSEWEGVFLDALDFNGKVGFMMGDPVDSLFSLFHTKDGGVTWNRCEGSVKAFPGEAGFAASGSNVYVMNDSTYMFISGGMKSNFYKSTNSGVTWSKVEIPYYPDETIGAYSMCFADDNLHGVIVGGNYLQHDLRKNTTYYTNDGGETWYTPQEHPPGGYRSCVYYVDGIFYACGTNGIDFSDNNGEDWHAFAEGTFFALTTINNKLIATMRHGHFQTFELVEK